MLNVAKMLRRNMTKEEKKLWYSFLQHHPLHFYRQRTIGNYVVDFYCAKAKLVIEVDGSQHYEESGLKKDAERTRFLESKGLSVIRLTNNEINRNLKEVCEYIDQIVSASLE